MRKILLFLFSFSFFISVFPQQKEPTSKKSLDILASAGIQMPIGDFSTTHSAGVSLDLAPVYHRFRLVNRESMKFPDGIAFTYNGGFTYYFGKSETVSGYSYKYPGYLFIHAFGGLFYVPSKKINTSLLAGPAVGIYNGNSKFNIGGRLEASYHIGSILHAGPLINWLWEAGTRSLWSAGIKFSVEL
ncbi:MAG: hypothetical protein HOP10_05165 [Chitinophagaceae bacterium]|nr:hypothetical protein [Chitinophagaceae bacterium]